jgi:hypothetical protein
MRIKTLEDLKNPKMREQARRDTEPSSLQPQVEQVLRQRKNKHTEADFQKSVIQIAQLKGWKVAHFKTIQTITGSWITPVAADGKGFLDLTLLRERLVVAELKAGTGLRPEQKEWIEAWRRAGVEPFVWTPADWPEIEEVLS